MKYKLIGCVLILTLLIGSSLVMLPLTPTGAASRIDYEAGVATPDPKTIYVDDDNVAGPWNGSREHPYQNITDGLGHAGTGDTLFVINGTYRENLEIKKMILLIGENKSNTIIDGKGSGTVVKVLENNVTIAKFTIQNSGKVTTIDSGICLYRDDNRINNNIIVNCSCGIKLSGSSSNVIASNVIQSNTHAIYSESSSSTFEKNVIRNNLWGIYLYSSSNNFIYHNKFDNNTNQIYIFQSFNNVWNLGYPSGGNYWSDYSGVDAKSGPNQDQAGSDGIGDTPYNITAQDRDHYPWLRTVHNVDTGLPYIWIQEAINATETKNGHTIRVDALMHYENVSVYKSLTLLPGGNLTTAIIDGNGTGRGLYISVSNVVVSNFTILNGKYGVQLSGAGNTILRNINMTNNTYNFFVHGTKLSHFINDIDNSNLVDGKQIYYLINNHDLVINSSTHPDLGYLGLVNCTNMIVQNLNLTGNGQGLLLASTNSSTIEHVNTSKHVYGIYLFDCSGSTITSNDIMNNEYYGVYSQYSSGTNVTGNNIAGDQSCIYLFNSNHSEIASNSMVSLAEESSGVYLFNSGNNNIVGNNITSLAEFSCGVDLWNSDNSNIVGNHITSDIGIEISDSDNSNIATNHIMSDYGIDISFSSGANVTGNHVTGTMAFSSYGITLSWSNSSNVAGNTLRNSNYGIYLQAYCFDNTVAINNVAENNFGILLGDSSDNELDDNDVTNNNDMGIYLRRSSYNNVTNNNITGNPEGVYLLNSINNTISGNNISKNTNGIYMSGSSGNNVIENLIKNNIRGIFLKSSNNRIYHNSFINNTNQVEVSAGYQNTWDNGYPSGGNYWSYYYYAVNDTYRGSFQYWAGSDGIGDKKYTINGTSNVDNYPLMKPYGGEHDIGIETVICPLCGAPYRAPDPLPGKPANCSYCGATFLIPSRLAGVIRSVYLSKTVFNMVLKPYDLYIWIKIINYGFDSESGITITVQVHNATYVKTIKNETFNLGYRDSHVFNVTWYTTGIAKGNYTITVSITHVTNETYIEDNVYSCNVNVTILGDINGDFKVDIKDLVLVIKAFGKYKCHSNWHENHLIRNADVNNDDKVDIKDLVLVIKHFGEHYP